MNTHFARLTSLLFCSIILLPACSPYAGAKKSVTAIGYGGGGERGLGITGAEVGVAVIGYLIKEADKAVTKARTGDYGVTADNVSGLSFSNEGYLVVLHTVKWNPKLAKVATIKDFLEDTPGTAGQDLRNQMSSHHSVAAEDIDIAVERLVTQKKINESDHIALLVVCPVKRLPVSSNAGNVYAVGFDGMYFPVLTARRFKGESSPYVQRFAKENESMTLEVYGPRGYQYTTGVINVPLVWHPPGKTGNAEWLSYESLKEEIRRMHKNDAQKQLDQLVSQDANDALAARRAVRAPTSQDHALLRADAKISETSQATGWLVKGIDKLGGFLTSAIKK